MAVNHRLRPPGRQAGRLHCPGKTRSARRAQKAIQTLQENGIKTMMMLTGDNQAVVPASAGNSPGRLFAEVLPDQKLEKIKALQESGEFVI